MSDSTNGPLFDNCVILAPDGVMLGRCERKRLDWYLKREIAELVAPDTIRLFFEPKGREGVGDPFNIEGKSNLCVVCGTTEELSRHHVIPHTIFRHFPEEMKDHNSHDVLPLCLPCHHDYEKKSHEKKQQLAEALGIPMTGSYDEEFDRMSLAVSLAKSLDRHGHRMPEERREDLLKRIRDIVGPIDYKGLYELSCKDFFELRESYGYRPFGQALVESVTDLNAFAQSWREHFVEVMQPKHLPSHWKIDRTLRGAV